MVARCRNIGVIGEIEFRRFRKLMSTYGYAKQEPLDDEMPAEEPRRGLSRRSIDMLLTHPVKDAAAILSDVRLSPAVISAITGIDMERFSPSPIAAVELTIL